MRDFEIKFQRGVELKKLLGLKIQEYFDSNSVILEEVKLNDSEIGLILNIKREIPIELSSLLGEILHNIRSSLDTALFDLVKKREPNIEKSKDFRKIQFPIKDCPCNFFSESTWHGNVLNEKEIGSLAYHQPFSFVQHMDVSDWCEFVKRAPLSRLRDLSNEDKHRQIRILNSELQLIALAINPDQEIKDGKFANYPWNNGDLVYSYRHDGPLEQRPSGKYEFDMCLAEDTRPMNSMSIMNLLESIIATTRDCLDRMRYLTT